MSLRVCDVGCRGNSKHSTATSDLLFASIVVSLQMFLVRDVKQEYKVCRTCVII